MDTKYLTKEKGQCKVEVIQYTKSPYNDTAIATLRCTYPRYIHSEVMTHRMFSRNSASSRATPTKVFLERIRNNPAFFTQLGINQSGMNASKVLDEKQAEEFKAEWLEMANLVVDKVESWTEKYNLHKQVVNRILEPFMMTTTIITATEWDNFFMTRLAEGVEPTMYDLADCMLNALVNAKVLCDTQNQEYSTIAWRHMHLPFVDIEEIQNEALEDCDALVLVTEWKEFRSPDFLEIKERLKNPVIFDGRNQYNAKKLQEIGFVYYEIGVGKC